VSKEIEEQHKTRRSLKSSNEETEAIEKQYSASARGMSKGTHKKWFHVEAPKFLTFNPMGQAGSQNIPPSPWYGHTPMYSSVLKRR
jgi:ribosomal protein S3AE